MHATGYSMPVYYWSGYRNYLQLQNLFENSKKGGNYTKFEAKPLFWD